MKEKTIHSDLIFAGQLIRLEVLDVELEDGTRTLREVVRHPGAVAVLACRDDGTLVLVRQYRKAVERYMLEVIAGTLHEGEDPAVCARREVEEETGYRVRELRPLGDIYPSPGYVDERIVTFFAVVEPGDGTREQDHDERVEAVELSRNKMAKVILDGGMTDAKSLAVWTLYCLHCQGDSAAS